MQSNTGEGGGSRKAARFSVCGAIVVALLWPIGLGLYMTNAFSLPDEMLSGLVTGLAIFCAVFAAPLLLVLLTLNWIVRRVAGVLIVLIFIYMASEVMSIGFGDTGSVVIALISIVLAVGTLFFLSRPPVLRATGDFYSFLNPRHVLSKYTFRRKPE